MFYNAGKKLRSIAKVLFWVIVIAVAIETIVRLVNGDLYGFGGFLIAHVIIAVGVLVAWLSTITLYAFGEMCENVISIEDEATRIRKIMEQSCGTPKVSNNATPNTPSSNARRFDPDSYPSGPVG